MILTDTHTHLYIESFEKDRDATIQRAIEAGVTRFFIPAIDASYTQAMYQLEANYPNHIFLMTGVHPTHIKENYKKELEYVERQLQKRKFYAIGEIGIDLYWDTTTLEIQEEAFHFQIALAKKYQLPIVIHCRNAFDKVFEILELHKGNSLRGIFHCFTGTLEQAQLAIDCQMKLGIGGVVTFKNGKINNFLHKIDLRHIVLETDSPYLAPIPYRGKRNESAYLVDICKKVAECYGISEEKVAEITTANSKTVFGI